MGGWGGVGWLEKSDIKLISTQVGVEVGVELGKKLEWLGPVSFKSDI